MPAPRPTSDVSFDHSAALLAERMRRIQASIPDEAQPPTDRRAFGTERAKEPHPFVTLMRLGRDALDCVARMLQRAAVGSARG